METKTEASKAKAKPPEHMGKKTQTEKLKIGRDSSPGLKLAYWYWMELGRPPRFHAAKTFLSWSAPMESLLAKSGLDYERFKWFLTWVTRLRDADGANYGNDYTATYLRAAREPVACLAKHFDEVFFTFFMPNAGRDIPLLMAKRQTEDELKEAKKKPVPVDEADRSLRHIDLLESWTKLYATNEDGTVEKCDVESFRVRLEWLDKLDDAFPMREPYLWESMEDWIDREFEILCDESWRCPNCKYAFSIDGGDDARIKLCADCEEERLLWAQDDLEWMHDGEAEEVFLNPYEAAITPIGRGG
jgi:hypothetical protein